MVRIQHQCEMFLINIFKFYLFDYPKNLIAVIGSVGSGKSSLFQAILGELPPESGSITVNGAVSYAAQEPWLFTGTENYSEFHA